MTAMLFDLAFALAAPFWALMIVAPRWAWTRRIIGSPLIVLGPLAVHLVVAVPLLPQLGPEVLGPDLAGVRELFATTGGTTAAWAHIIAFDLFVGRWIYLDGREHGRHPLLMAPVLVVTILLAPFGLLSYLLIRAVSARRASAGDQGQQGSLRPAGEPDRRGGVGAQTG
jgi:hypothetical protein